MAAMPMCLAALARESWYGCLFLWQWAITDHLSPESRSSARTLAENAGVADFSPWNGKSSTAIVICMSMALLGTGLSGPLLTGDFARCHQLALNEQANRSRRRHIWLWIFLPAFEC